MSKIDDAVEGIFVIVVGGFLIGAFLMFPLEYYLFPPVSFPILILCLFIWDILFGKKKKKSDFKENGESQGMEEKAN